MTIRTATTLIAVSVVSLTIVGLVMLGSTSPVRAAVVTDDPLFFLKRQGVWLVLAMLAGLIALRMNYHLWKRLSKIAAALVFVLLVLVVIPGVGVEAGGSRRWLQVGPMRLQPSELAKIVMVVSLATWMCRVERRARNLREGILIPLAGLIVLLVLLYFEPDYGTIMLCAAVGIAILFVGGASIPYLAIGGSALLAVIGFAIWLNPNRLGRVMAFLFPDEHPELSYHLAQSKLAIMNGGLFGVGLGNSIQKQLYLPEAHTDFILAIIGEELGLLATGMIVVLFSLILLGGLRISARAPDSFGRYLGFGCTLMLVMQAAVNVGVVTGCLPTKGLALPFISYGGSSLMTSLTLVGIILSIARHCKENPDDFTDAIKDRSHQF